MRASSSDNPIFQGFPKSANVHGGYRSATTDTFSMVMMMLIVLHVGLKLNPKVRLNALDFQEPSHQFQKLLRMAAFRFPFPAFFAVRLPGLASSNAAGFDLLQDPVDHAPVRIPDGHIEIEARSQPSR